MRSVEKCKPVNPAHLQCWTATVLCGFVSLVGGCSRNETEPHAAYMGNAQQGLVIIERSGCGSCHLVPGVPDSEGLVGPPLHGFAHRRFVAGLLPNTPDHLIYWIRFPQSVVPGNVMPNSGLSEDQARDVAAYLATLE